MARRKRKKSNKPNIPQATLDRAREQAGLAPAEEVEEIQDEVISSDEAVDSSEAVAETPASLGDIVREQKTEKPAKAERPRRRRSKVSAAQLEKAKQKGNVDNEMVTELLLNPTIEVSEEQLHNEYGYVLKDLRNMGILAAVLLVLLVGLAQFI